MLETLIAALLPIVITLILGFFAGWHHDFSSEQGSILNRMIMLYALPMSLFAGIISTPKQQIINNLGMFGWLALGMGVGLLVVFIISHFIFKRPKEIAILQSLAITGPAVPFVGVSVLGAIFDNISALPIAICGLLMNLIQVPITIMLLTNNQKTNNQQINNQLTLSNNVLSVIINRVIAALKEPVVWAPIAGFILVLIGINLTGPLLDSFTLLGKATGGVALFASGIILFAQKVTISWPVIINTLSKNIILPAVIGIIMYFCGATFTMQHLVVITLSIPTASIVVILAVQYKVAEQEMASTLFVSTLLSIISMGIFIWLF